MRWLEQLYKSENRSFSGQRYASILLRLLHLFGISGSGTAFLFQVPQQQWLPYLILTIASGVALFVLEIWGNAICLLQLRGLATLIKLGILSLVFLTGPDIYILFPVIMISGFMAHAPARIRYYLWIRLVDDP